MSLLLLLVFFFYWVCIHRCLNMIQELVFLTVDLSTEISNFLFWQCYQLWFSRCVRRLSRPSAVCSTTSSSNMVATSQKVPVLTKRSLHHLSLANSGKQAISEWDLHYLSSYKQSRVLRPHQLKMPPSKLLKVQPVACLWGENHTVPYLCLCHLLLKRQM